MRSGFRSGKALPIILGVAVLVSGGAGAGVGIFLGQRAAASSKKDKKKHSEEPKVIYSLGEMVINLADADTLRYVKVTAAIGYEEKVPEDKLKEITPVLRDVVLTVVSKKKFTDLHKPDGTAKVKEEIREALEAKFEKLPIVEIYFEGFAMQ